MVIQDLQRRAKYLLLHMQGGSILIHLGMSGSLRLLPNTTPATKHDHVDLELDAKTVLRLNDPRKFGSVLWVEQPYTEHHLLARLGPEPLTKNFDGEYLFRCTRKRRASIKSLIMNANIVVGVGNIYASESLFLAGIRPSLAAGRMTRKRCHALAEAIKQVLQRAIKAGGTSLNDFLQADGQPGYFSQKLLVYGRRDEPCQQCEMPIKSMILGQRNTFYCPRCQSF